MQSKILTLAIFTLFLSCSPFNKKDNQPHEISGIYPHLAMYNSQGECGTGAVVPWAGRLWVITYSPHFPKGSDDKLYGINSDLDADTLFPDGNVTKKEGDMEQEAELLPGSHGKGLYSGQGVMVYSNNGETGQEALRKFDVKSGALAEWDGNEWTIVRRNQFVEVTGPGGIYGNPNPETDPIWATGWDHKSIILGVRNPKTGWDFYRLPKASHSYDGAHGWNTEWPRIRDVGTETSPDYLMTMHGMFWRFPETFTAENSAGVRPRSAYLKVIGDFTRWNDRLVFGCDDSAQKEFLNKRKQKGDHIILSEDENAAVWAGAIDDLWEMGKPVGHGGPWKDTNVKAGEPSDPYLIGFYDKRSIEMFHDASEPVTFKIEVEPIGHGPWLLYKELTVEPGGKLTYLFPESFQARWIRCVADKNCLATAWLEYN